MEQIYLTRRNLLTLLSKLNRKKSGESTERTLIKSDNRHPEFPQSMPHCMVTALEDEEYYTDRPYGEVHQKDDPNANAQVHAKT